MADSGWVLVDDRDQGIVYGPLDAVILQGGVSQGYMETTSGLGAGDTATYLFNAPSIAVFGTYAPGDYPIAIYQVDDAPATTVSAPFTQVTLYRQNFWTSESLASGASHKLVVTETAPNSTLWIDYLAYPPSSTATTSSTSSTTSASSSIFPKRAITTLSTITPTTNVGSQTASPAGASHTNANISAIVMGIAVVTIAFMLVAAALVICCGVGDHAPLQGNT